VCFFVQLRPSQVVVRNRISGILLDQLCIVGNGLIVFEVVKVLIATTAIIRGSNLTLCRNSYPAYRQEPAPHYPFKPPHSHNPRDNKYLARLRPTTGKRSETAALYAVCGVGDR